MTSGQQNSPNLSLPRAWRWLAYGLVGTLVALAFWAYNTPQMVMMWETFLALCGWG